MSWVVLKKSTKNEEKEKMTTKKTKKELEQLVKKETELIAKLESEGPLLDSSVDTYHKNNTFYHQHVTKIRDSYWRRRNWRDQLQDVNNNF